MLKKVDTWMDETRRTTFFSGEFKWMSRLSTSAAVEECTTINSSLDNTSRESEIYTYSDKNGIRIVRFGIPHLAVGTTP